MSTEAQNNNGTEQPRDEGSREAAPPAGIQVITSWAHRPSRTLVEQVYDPMTRKIAFEVYANGQPQGVNEVTSSGLELMGHRIKPLDDEGIRVGAIRLPQQSEPYGDKASLVLEIREFLRREVKITSEEDEALIVYYILYTWLFDRVPVAPYLRIMGDYGAGKSRLADTISLLTYRTLVAQGASSGPAIFRTLHALGGATLSLDEFDLRAQRESDQDKMDILRGGYTAGQPIMRAGEVNKATGRRATEYFNAFGPKILTGRDNFPDAALESRCFKIVLPRGVDIKGRVKHVDVDREQTIADALRLRNKLLRFRQENYFEPLREVDPPGNENRLAQLVLPILMTVGDDTSDQVFGAAVMGLSDDIIEDRRRSPEGILIQSLMDLWRGSHTDDNPVRVHLNKLAEVANKKVGRGQPPFTPKTVRTKLEGLPGVVIPPKDKKGLFIDFHPDHFEFIDEYLVEPDAFDISPAAFEAARTAIAEERIG